MTNNLSYNGMEEVVNNMVKVSRKKPETKREVGDEWKRLAAFNQK